MLPQVSELGQLLGIKEDDIASATYADQCHTGGVRGGMDFVQDLGIDLGNRLAPVAFVLRTGEAIDAIENFMASANATTSREAASFVLCGLMQVSRSNSSTLPIVLTC